MAVAEIASLESELSTGESLPPAARRRRGQRRPFAERLTPGLVAGVIAALLAFVVIAGLLRERRAMTSVVVPARALTAGELVTVGDVDVVEVPSDVQFAGEFVSEVDVVAGGVYAGRLLRAGEPILRSATSETPEVSGRRTMALPLPDWGATGGPLEIGDQIDVIDTGGETPRYIVQDAAVITRSTDDTSAGLGAQRGVWVSIEVTETQALDVAGVVETDSFVVVRSGGP